MPIETSFHSKDHPHIVKYTNDLGQLHREDGPAAIKYDIYGFVVSEEWGINGVPHRIGGPAIINFYAAIFSTNDGSKRKNGKQLNNECWFENGDLHRIGGPAQTNYYPDGTKSFEQYYVNGRLHRLDGPSRQYWFSNGKIKYREYHVDGKYFNYQNPNDPVYITWHTDTEIISEEQYFPKDDMTPCLFRYDLNGNVIERGFFINGVGVLEKDIKQIVDSYGLPPSFSDWSDEDKLLIKMSIGG